jgi:tight adherence protein C
MNYLLIAIIVLGIMYLFISVVNTKNDPVHVVDVVHQESLRKKVVIHKQTEFEVKLTRVVSILFSEEALNKLENQLIKAGRPSNLNASKYILLQFIFAVASYVIITFTATLGYVFGAFFAFALYNIIHYFIVIRSTKHRKERIENETLYFFEVLSLSLESGVGFEQGLNVTCERVPGELSDEFRQMLFEKSVGKSLTDSMNSMRERLPSEVIDNILISLVQAIRMGTSVVTTLHNQVNYLRDARFMLAREKAGKLPNKMSSIAVLFLLPSLLIILGGPILLTFLN